MPIAQRERLQAVFERPAAILVPLAVVLGATTGALLRGSDAALFLSAGRRLLSGDGLDVFADPTVQVGPLTLAVWGLGARLGSVASVPWAPAALAGAAWAGTLVALALRTTFRQAVRYDADPVIARWAVGLFVVVGGSLGGASSQGHLEEVVVALLLLEAAWSIGDGRARRGGVLLAVATAIKLWAVLGAGAILLARSWRERAQAVAIWAGLVVVVNAPFWLGGEVRTFELRWDTGLDPAVRMLIGALGASWWVRALQATLAVAAGAVVARRRPHDPMLLVIAAIATRVVVDPLAFAYYLSPLLLLLVVRVWSRPDFRRARAWVTLAAVAVTQASGLLALPPAGVRLVALATLVVARPPRPRQPDLRLAGTLSTTEQ